MSELMYNDKEIELLKATFAENDFLLLAIRKLFFGGELTDEQKKVIVATFKSKEVRGVFQRKVYGLNNLDTPVGQLSDFWLGAEKQIFGASKDTIKQALHSKARVLAMFEQSFKLLTNPDGEKIKIDYSIKARVLTMFKKVFKILTNPDGEKIKIDYSIEEDDELGIGLIARNMYMQAIETSILTIKTIAGQKSESVKDTVARLQQDSTK